MNPHIAARIKDLRCRSDSAGMYLGAGATPNDILALTARAKAELSEDLPAPYLDFLRHYDGLIAEGVFVYSSVAHPFPGRDGHSLDFMNINLISREVDFMKEFLIFGDSDMDEYVLELATQKYQVRDKQAIDNVYEEFASFDELLEFMLGLIEQRI
ncbi:YrhA family protein [Pseudomonas sp. KNUC1026]|uniref:YrhA family protein n=1 Tax=Pseudomonas sp. KNUC1026 TaxID=2893890 RepID=UPI001F340DB8|nr:YrhA family protein [Pseudomonas sp. KNUC1026]UFH51180.1 SMI1/KNR4 family protein [Pseudomonas sp. KNUC1026]